MEDCRGPGISPDGQCLLFARRQDGRLRWFTSSPPGAPPKRLRDDLPELQNLGAYNAGFSRDGSKFAGVDIKGQVWVVPFPSGAARPIPFQEPVRYVAWFPDSRHLLVNASAGAGNTRLAIADSESGASRVVLQSPDVSISGTVSPDGERIAYSAGAADIDVVEYTVDGRRGRVLAATSRMDTAAHWSPRGDQFAYLSNALGSLDLWTRSADGLRTTRLLVGDLSNLIQSPRFSPDGRRIAYCFRNRLWVVAASGGQPIAVYTGDGRLGYPAWSPDGEHLAVADGTRLVKVPAGGGDAVVVKRDFASEGDVEWSPNGKWIAYVRRGEGYRLVNADGTEDRLLATASGFRLIGDFTPDGALYLLARSTPQGGWELATFDAATGRPLKSAPLELDSAETLASLKCHPDGRHLALSTGRLTYDIWMIEGFPQPAQGWFRFFRHWSAPSPPVSRFTSDGRGVPAT